MHRSLSDDKEGLLPLLLLLNAPLGWQAVGLQKQQHVRADALSGGMKRRLQVALALLGSSCVILLGTESLTCDVQLTSMVILHRMET